MKVKKWFKKLFQKRFASNKDLADAIVDCFRNDDGTVGFSSSTFRDVNNGSMTDNEGNKVFYAKVYVDAACNRIDDLVNQLRNGEEVTQPDMIPRVRLRGFKRDDDIMFSIRSAFHAGTEEEMIWRNCLQNGYAVDREMIKFIVKHLKLDSAANPDEMIINDFAACMKNKMNACSEAGQSGWGMCSNAALIELLNAAVAKGDPVDVANYAMMLHFKGGKTSVSPIEFTFAPKDSENETAS